MLNKLTSRKFIIALMCILSATGLASAGHIADGVYATVMVATAGAYIAGNVYEKVNSDVK
jgi:hypothetical protein